MRRDVAIAVAVVASVGLPGCGVQSWAFEDGADAGRPSSADTGSAAVDSPSEASATEAGGSCGEPGIACCSGDTCAAGNRCHRVEDGGSICSPCGEPGEPCCLQGSCGSGGCCDDDLCTAAGSTCPNVGGTCQAGSCGTCGGAGQPCCAGGECTASGLGCQSGKCVSCGSQECESADD